MVEKADCRKCSGPGEYAYGGVCFACNGSGKVDDIRYQTTPASESSHPSMRAAREEKPDPFIPPDPAHVEARLREMHALLAADGLPGGGEAEAMDMIQALCEHEFVEAPYGPMCMACGMFQAQHEYSMTAPLKRWSDLDGGV